MDLERMLSHLDGVVVAKTIVQLFIIVYAVLWVWSRIIGTQAERLVKGVIIISLIFLASYFAGFTIITSLLQHLIPVAAMAMVVVFQPEIRRGLGYLGRVKTIRTDLSLADSEQEKLKRDIEQIIAAVKELSRSKTGALIVIEPPEGERDYVSPGTPVKADISMNLLLTIFFHKSPLHDGAVVIRNDKIVAAGVILPMTSNPKLSYRYGTRHRAAIGLSEIYDGLCIVVSEETGSISAASRGMLVRYQNADELADPIEYLYHTPEQSDKATTPWQSFLNMFKKGHEPTPSAQDLSEIHHFTDSMSKIPDSMVKPGSAGGSPASVTGNTSASPASGTGNTGIASGSAGIAPENAGIAPENAGIAPGSAGGSPASVTGNTNSSPASTTGSKHDETAEDIAEYKEESYSLPEPRVLGEAQPARKTANDVDTLPPANEVKPRTSFGGKEKRKDRRTNDLPSPMSFEEPEGVH
ncbi:MAG: TIGR00159 family protein [Candidatus Melainabacteria bacterium]|nr:MAG: TIGR00159 family protein [Candidatus Melainabacteria bacterium]